MSRTTFDQWAKKLFRRRRNTRKTRNLSRVSTFEQLGARITPTVNAFSFGGVLTVLGDHLDRSCELFHSEPAPVTVMAPFEPALWPIWQNPSSLPRPPSLMVSRPAPSLPTERRLVGSGARAPRRRRARRQGDGNGRQPIWRTSVPCDGRGLRQSTCARRLRGRVGCSTQPPHAAS
jgi:hypothetical protein